MYLYLVYKCMCFNTANTCISIHKVVAYWYVSVVSTFPNTFALVLDSNLHDLNGTNPDWHCFQQNCHGVVLCAESKVLGMTWNFTEHLFGNNKKSLQKMKTRGPTTYPRGWGACLPPRARPPTSWAPWSSSDLKSNSIYLLSGRKKPERRIHRVLRYGAAAKP